MMRYFVLFLLLSASAHAATLNWTASEVDPALNNAPTGYYVYIGSLTQPAAEVGKDVLSYDVGLLEPGVQYTFGVSAFNAKGESPIQPLTIMYQNPADPPPSRPGSIWVLPDPMERPAAPQP